MGAWVCFDEIDRMKWDEISLIAEEIRSIQVALQEKMNRLKFEHVEIPLNVSCNIMFIIAQPYEFFESIYLCSAVINELSPILICV